jgi:hypothetical protein
MRFARALLFVGFAALASGCYRQVVNTGRAPAPTTVNKPWTATWLWGLVPAQAIDVTQQCPGGIATVTTQQSVPNGLATIVTLGLFTPRSVTVQCAQSATRPGADEVIVSTGLSREAREEALLKAAQLSAQTGRSISVRF